MDAIAQEMASLKISNSALLSELKTQNSKHLSSQDEITSLKLENQRLKDELIRNSTESHKPPPTKDPDQEKWEEQIISQYMNSENYLIELVEEFKIGMKQMYEEFIDFKNVDDPDLEFCERFSNLLYNVLLIIDHQKRENESLQEQQVPVNRTQQMLMRESEEGGQKKEKEPFQEFVDEELANSDQISEKHVYKEDGKAASHNY